MSNIKMYQVGGCVRDKILGLKSKDIDYAVEASSYEDMKKEIIARGGEIFKEEPHYFAIKGKIKNEVADFVLCRKDSRYTDGRRPDSVEIGTLYEDLSRRDFTMNGLCIDEDGKIIDHFGGEKDIQNKIIRCIGDPVKRFTEDSLRMLRAIRFAITKDFYIDYKVHDCLQDSELISLIKNVSGERIREELFKCFYHDTSKTLILLNIFKKLSEYIFDKENFGIWLEPTNRK